MNRGYISVLFILVSGLFVIAMVATAVTKLGPFDFSPRATEGVRKFDLLPSERGEVICKAGGKLVILSSDSTSAQVICDARLPSN